ncbi:MAG: P-II family nitrogen regulator [Nitrosopumilaceae archaeon]
MKRIDILVPGDKLREVGEAIKNSGAGGFLVVSGKGQGKGDRPSVGGGRGTARYVAEYNSIESVMTIVDDSKADKVVNAVIKATSTGSKGDGKIFVTTIDDAYDIGSKQKCVSAI